MERFIRPECPWCRRSGTSTDLIRVQRRFVDRMISLVRLRYRYRCRTMGCGWEGSFPARGDPMRRGAPPSPY